jgi:hypothetical protein
MPLVNCDGSEVINFAYYRYDPSMAGAVLFILLFMATTFYHTFQLLKTRTWLFIPFVVGEFCECEISEISWKDNWPLHITSNEGACDG